MLWNDLSSNKSKCIVCIDEAHKLLKSFGRYHSIYTEMAREIRAFGKLWTSTQNYTDLDDSIRNQFATQFIFNTSNEKDLNALRIIDEKLKYAACTMPRHVFTDARYEWIYKTVPEFTLYWFPRDNEHLNDGKSDNIINVIRSVALEPKSINDMPGDKNSNAAAIIDLKNDNLLKSVKINDDLYFLNRRGISDAHLYMQRIVKEILLKHGYKPIEAKPGEDKPDIMTEKFNIEIETGFKHDKKDLLKRINKSDKTTLIIVPNEKTKGKYKNLNVIEIKDFENFLNKIKN